MTYKQTFWRTLAAVAAMLLTMPATVWAESTFGGGSGTITDPYQIYNPAHFVQLADEVNAGNTFDGVYFKLTSSIDFRLYGQIPPIGGQYYTEGGTTGIRRFCGSFLGNNRTLYNLTITENPAHCGLFGYLGYGGYVSDLIIDGNSTITGIGGAGAVVGLADSNTYIFNCTVGENVVVKVHPDAVGSSYRPGTFGGIVGSTNGRVSGCVSKATISISGVTKTTELGGIVGAVGTSGKIEENYFLGSIDGTNTVGDIAGTNDGTISRCYYHTANRHGGVNGADTDGAKWMGTVTMADGVSGSLPSATYTDGNKSYFAADNYMLLTLNYTVPEGYCQAGDQVTYMANDVAIGETERYGQPYYEFTMPNEDVTISTDVDLKRDIAYTPWVKINIPALTYAGEPLTPAVQVTDIKDGTQQALTEGVHFTITLPGEIIDVGDYTATINGIGDWSGTTSATFQVVPAGSVGRIITPPAAIEGLKFNGQPQVLITAGEAENGTLLYRLENTEYSAELPSATDIGTYIVYYKVHTDNNHFDTSERSLGTHIWEADITMWDGEGTAESPYLIYTIDDMNRIAINRDRMDYDGVYFSLENDIDYEGARQLPIGTLEHRFNGIFNGNGHTLTNMVINKPNDNYVAIFGVVNAGGVISDLHVGDGSSIVGAECVGYFASLMTGAVTGCTTAPGVTVSGSREVGGIVGRCAGTIDRCVNRATVTSSGTIAGGIAGGGYSSTIRTISNSLNLGSVEAIASVGGIVGYDFGATYSNNYYAGDCNTGGVSGRDHNGKAQRGYTVTGGNNVTIELAENATAGVAYNEAVYAGAGQQVVLRLSAKQSEAQSTPSLLANAQTMFKASNGELADNGDGTWTLIMPESGADVIISIDNDTVTGIEDIVTTTAKSGQRYNLMGQPVGKDYKGIVIEDGKKRVIK